MTLEPKFQDQILALERQTAFEYLMQRDYKSLADLVKGNIELAKIHGRTIVGQMWHHLSTEGKNYTYGHQLTGYQLQILAYARKAGAPVGEGDITKYFDSTVHFDYVARIEREGRGYVAQFPDLQGCLTQGRNLAEVGEQVKDALIGYISSKMLHGDTLPVPKYHGRKTEKVRPLKVQLTLADLVFTDDQAAKDEQARGDFAYRTQLAQLKAR